MRLLAVLSCLMLMTVTVYAAEDIPGSPHLRVANRDVAISPDSTDSLVAKIRPYAAMSELAYRAYSPETPKDKTSGKKDPKQRAEDWEQLDKWLTTQQHWEFLGHKEYRSGDKSEETLQCDLWMNKMTVPSQIVVAFRGTEGDDDVRPTLSDEYAGMHKPEFRRDVMEACLAAGPDVVLTATGHSLGGDLAQHLFYYSQLWPTNRVTQVTVFDPSPLSGWDKFGSEEERRLAVSRFTSSLAAATTHWRFPDVMAFQYGFGTIRVNEGEGNVSYLRSMFRTNEPEETYISALNFDFGNGEPEQQHSMAKLAQDLYYYPATSPASAKARNAPPADDPAARAAELHRILNQS